MGKTAEVQFYLPAAQVELGDGEWGESDRVGEKHQGSVLR